MVRSLHQPAAFAIDPHDALADWSALTNKTDAIAADINTFFICFSCFVKSPIAHNKDMEGLEIFFYVTK